MRRDIGGVLNTHFLQNVPCPPPQNCGLDQLNTKNNIPLDLHAQRNRHGRSTLFLSVVRA